MTEYRHDPEALNRLVRADMVHRDVYVNAEVFELEMERLFANTWVYVGHESQTPHPGDFITTTIGRQPIVMCRDADQTLHVLYNRCAHKGVKIAAEERGNTGHFFRCPYHAWCYKLDGGLLSVPIKRGYEGSELDASPAALGLTRVAHANNYRGFVFARLSGEGPSFEAFFGESLSSIDNMIDRSPAGQLVVEGEPLRYLHACNWKMLVENQTDTCHPMIVHESSAGTAVKVWKQADPEAEKPMAVELYQPFTNSYAFFEKMGIRVWPNGHGHTGVTTSIHADYSAIPGYFEAMASAYGAERAKAILGENRHNTIYFPNIMVKGPIQTLRVFKPLAVDRTLVESWTFRLVDAPDLMFARTLMYNRLINAPTSIVGHDDIEMYERAQQGLSADPNPWVNLQRQFEPGERHDECAVVNGTSERQIRNQFAAWRHFMAPPHPSAQSHQGRAGKQVAS